MSASDDERFQLAVKFLETHVQGKNATIKASNAQLLSLYGLFKQADKGKCNTKAPSRLKLVDHAKWSAWNALGNLSRDEARTRLIAEVGKLDAGWESKIRQAKL